MASLVHVFTVSPKYCTLKRLSSNEDSLGFYYKVMDKKKRENHFTVPHLILFCASLYCLPKGFTCEILTSSDDSLGFYYKVMDKETE